MRQWLWSVPLAVSLLGAGLLFLVIAVITVVGYLAFRHMLGSPQ